MRHLHPPYPPKKSLFVRIPKSYKNTDLKLPSITPRAQGTSPNTTRIEKMSGHMSSNMPPHISINSGNATEPSESSIQSTIHKVRPPNGESLFPIPSKPAFIFSKFRNYLHDYEESEILNYREVYYLRQSPVQSKKMVTQIPNFFHFVKDDHIAYRYQQIQVIGKGSFGSVFGCIDHKTGEKVAIKMLRDKPKVHSQIIFELDLLKLLQVGEGEYSHHVVKYIESFSFRGFFCIVMELLSIDIYTALKYQRFIGFRKSVIQTVARETAEALSFIHQTGIIHADIKPENILFVDKSQSSIKVIDYGCSCFIGKLLFSYIQSRYYRAPEVVFGMQYGPEIDIWSLGCVLCEMVTGQPVFPAEDETELIQMIANVIGLPPNSMIKSAPRAHHYFDEKGQIKIKSNSSGKYHYPAESSLERAIRAKDRLFVDLIEGCLRWDPKERLTAKDVLAHPWVTQALHGGDEIPSSARASF
ncbi:CMGC family protein kinase [Tritrichomonas foetus]|uniref:dual-specificity kinase n=1 Tax=Tritrichomonas foetus TaxID=1144522 RepID=A0A1J4KSN1_9EUKA|nr:CMGC family protein kinase [Tritrichomonas foetus]|eukprot:OHT14297.1 CMGC family protein kinase [Tritrichomonas foetus]